MNIDIVLYLVFLLPLVWIVVNDINKLNDRKVFIKYFILSIIILTFGILFNYYSQTENKDLSYFGSQILIIFLLMQKILRYTFLKYSKENQFSDIISLNFQILSIV